MAKLIKSPEMTWEEFFSKAWEEVQSEYPALLRMVAKRAIVGLTEGTLLKDVVFTLTLGYMLGIHNLSEDEMLEAIHCLKAEGGKEAET